MSLMDELVANEYYWVRSRSAGGNPSLQIALLSSIFGPTPEFFSLIVPGSEQHHAIEDFEFIAHIPTPK